MTEMLGSLGWSEFKGTWNDRSNTFINVETIKEEVQSKSGNDDFTCAEDDQQNSVCSESHIHTSVEILEVKQELPDDDGSEEGDEKGVWSESHFGTPVESLEVKHGLPNDGGSEDRDDDGYNCTTAWRAQRAASEGVLRGSRDRCRSKEEMGELEDSGDCAPRRPHVNPGELLEAAEKARLQSDTHRPCTILHKEVQREKRLTERRRVAEAEAEIARLEKVLPGLRNHARELERFVVAFRKAATGVAPHVADVRSSTTNDHSRAPVEFVEVKQELPDDDESEEIDVDGDWSESHFGTPVESLEVKQEFVDDGGSEDRDDDGVSSEDHSHAPVEFVEVKQELPDGDESEEIDVDGVWSESQFGTPVESLEVKEEFAVDGGSEDRDDDGYNCTTIRRPQRAAAKNVLKVIKEILRNDSESEGELVQNTDPAPRRSHVRHQARVTVSAECMLLYAPDSYRRYRDKNNEASRKSRLARRRRVAEAEAEVARLEKVLPGMRFHARELERFVTVLRKAVSAVVSHVANVGSANTNESGEIPNSKMCHLNSHLV